jgi:hypothetical protein
MASREKYRQKWLKYHSTYEKRSVSEFYRVFKKWNKDIQSIEFSKDTILAQLSLNTDIKLLENAYFNVYNEIGKKHGKRIGKFINEGLKFFSLDDFLIFFAQQLPLFMAEFGVNRVQQIKTSYISEVFELFNKRLLDGYTLDETTEEVFKIMKGRDFYRWQAERIARTETTGAANYSAMLAGKKTGFVMEKEWISATDARVRRKPDDKFDHLEMNGKRVDLNGNFVFNLGQPNTDFLAYPVDPKGRAGNTINCRCTIAVLPKKDNNGNLIRSIQNV